jgi:hypothetical protein
VGGSPAPGERIDLASFAEREVDMGLQGIRWSVQGIRPPQPEPLVRGAPPGSFRDPPVIIRPPILP